METLVWRWTLDKLKATIPGMLVAPFQTNGTEKKSVGEKNILKRYHWKKKRDKVLILSCYREIF